MRGRTGRTAGRGTGWLDLGEWTIGNGVSWVTPIAGKCSKLPLAFVIHLFGVRGQGMVAFGAKPDTVFCSLELQLMTQSTMRPPRARQEPTPTTLHGHTLEDNYRWMRDKTSPELVAYLEAENAYTNSVVGGTEPLQAKLYAEMLSHIKETDESVPYRDRGWFYYTRTVEGLQYPIHCRRLATGAKFDESQPEEILLDVNQLAQGQAFMAVGGMTVSPDGAKLAYSTDNTG